jgi:hypothetical protein
MSCGLKLVLKRLAHTLGFCEPLLKVDEMSDRKYRGSVTLNKGDNDVEAIQGTPEISWINAKSSTIYHTISFLSRENNIVVIDPSYFVLQYMRKTRNSIITKMLNLAVRANDISNIGTYIEGEIGRIANEIDKSTKEGTNMVHVIYFIIEGIQELTWNNWANAICN